MIDGELNRFAASNQHNTSITDVCRAQPRDATLLVQSAHRRGAPALGAADAAFTKRRKESLRRLHQDVIRLQTRSAQRLEREISLLPLLKDDPVQLFAQPLAHRASSVSIENAHDRARAPITRRARRSVRAVSVLVRFTNRSLDARCAHARRRRRSRRRRHRSRGHSPVVVVAASTLFVSSSSSKRRRRASQRRRARHRHHPRRRLLRDA